MNKYENRTELMHYLDVLWKRRWFIIISTFIFIAAATVISFLLPTQWEVDAMIYPSKYHILTEQGLYKSILFVENLEMAKKIKQGVYNAQIASDLSLDLKDLPKLNVEHFKKTYLLRISIKERNVEKAKLILYSLCSHLKREYDNYTDRKKMGIDSQIKSKETDKLTLEKKVITYKNKINIINQRKKEVKKEMSDIGRNIERLTKERNLILKKKNRSEFESFAFFQYSNEIQHSLLNQKILNESLSKNELEEEIINLNIEDKEILINKIENEINDLKEKKEHIYYARITKEPTSSISPVSPNKSTNIMIAGILGLLISGMFIFFLEYIENQKSKSKT